MLVAGKERCIRCMHLLDEEGHCAKCEFDASSYKQPNMALPLGTCLNERYFLGKVLGEGGFGITYVAWDIVLMVPVAVKEYFPSGIATREKEGPQTGTLQIYEGKSELEFEKGKEDFLKEARSLSRFMKLPSIVSVRDFFQENRTAYIVMEYVEGTRVRNYIRKNGKMSGEQVLALMEPVIHSLWGGTKCGTAGKYDNGFYQARLFARRTVPRKRRAGTVDRFVQSLWNDVFYAYGENPR